MDMSEGPAIYVIVLGQVIVAQDIAQAISDFDPAAMVITTRHRADAVTALDALGGRLAMAFINTAPDGLATDVLAQAAMARAARIVLIHDAAEVQGEREGYWVLPRPFTTEDVLALMHRR